MLMKITVFVLFFRGFMRKVTCKISEKVFYTEEWNVDE